VSGRLGYSSRRRDPAVGICGRPCALLPHHRRSESRRGGGWGVPAGPL